MSHGQREAVGGSPRTIAISNQKGGVGKTTTTANLGAALAEAGHRVLLVDLDPQAALTATFGLNPYDLDGSVDRLLLDGDGDLPAIARPVAERLWLAPTSGRLALREMDLGQGPEHAAPLARLFPRGGDAGNGNGRPGPVRLPYDFVLVDTPPNLGPLTRGALAAVDELLVPVQCEYLAIRGVRGLLMAVWEIHQQLNPHLDLLGVLGTRFRSTSPHSREVVDELRSVFRERVFEVVVEDDEALAAAPVAHRSVLALAPGGPAAAAYRKLAREVRERDAPGTGIVATPLRPPLAAPPTEPTREEDPR